LIKRIETQTIKKENLKFQKPKLVLKNTSWRLRRCRSRFFFSERRWGAAKGGRGWWQSAAQGQGKGRGRGTEQNVIVRFHPNARGPLMTLKKRTKGFKKI